MDQWFDVGSVLMITLVPTATAQQAGKLILREEAVSGTAQKK